MKKKVVVIPWGSGTGLAGKEPGGLIHHLKAIFGLSQPDGQNRLT